MAYSKTTRLAACWFLGLATPALAGSMDGAPQVIPGLGPASAAQYGAPAPGNYRPYNAPQTQRADAAGAGRYGGGLIEFMMTGHNPTPSIDHPIRRGDYVATTSGTYGQPAAPLNVPSAGQQMAYAPQAAGPAGYEMPRKPVDPAFQRQEVAFDGPQAEGSIVVDTTNKFLYLIEGGHQALRYGIGVGRPGFLWHGEKTITRKAEWPDWTPPAEMVMRRPDLPAHMDGGIANPLGARAMYLGSSLYRIHGTNEPDTIGTNVSSGCIRLTNDDVSDLFSRVKVGTHVYVM